VAQRKLAKGHAERGTVRKRLVKYNYRIRAYSDLIFSLMTSVPKVGVNS